MHEREVLFDGRRRDLEVVPLSLEWTRGQPVVILSGPNGGGKTVALKTIALIVLLARMGWPVPAQRGTRIPLVSNVVLYVGDEQDVLQDLSTFTAIMVRIASMVARVDRGSIFFIDEAGFGTDPEEGSALATAILEYVCESGGRAFITTHLTALKMLPLTRGEFVNASMEFDSGSHRPTYRCLFGQPGSSHALDVAQSVGLPSGIVTRARSLLGGEGEERQRLLEQLQEKITLYRRKEGELKDEEKRLKAERERMVQDFETKRQDLIQEWREWRETTLRDLAVEVERMREEGVRIGKKREHSLRSRVQEHPEGLREKEESPPRLEVRQEVRLEGSRAVGWIRELQNGGRVCIEMEGKELWVDVSLVTPTGKVRKEGTTVAFKAAEPSMASLNVVGMNVDEALEETDSAMDRALLSGISFLKIIHGHGTGKLRRAIRSHLRNHPLVRNLHPTPDNGGTEVEL